LDDKWDPPPRVRNRFAAVITVVVLGVTGALFITIRAGVEGQDVASAQASQHSDAPASNDMWYPDSGNAVWARSRFALPAANAKPRPAPRATRTKPAPAPPRPPVPSAPSYLSVNSMPWALLAVDGKVIGHTPQVSILVTPGRHHVGLARAGFEAHSEWVTVRPGETVKITGIALKRVAP
jgi:hypothetical protein